MALLKEEIKSFLKGDVADDSETLEKYSKDYSLFKIKPKVVVFPKDAEDVGNLVKFADAQNKKGRRINLTARSGGTDMTGGPLGDSVVVEFTRYFNQIKKIVVSSDGGNVVVQSGVYYRDFEKELGKKGLMFPPYPASKNICAVGGMLANNSGGEKTLAYGKTEDYVQELKVVLSDGKEHIIKPLSKSEFFKKMEEKGFESDLYRELWRLIDKNKALIQKARPNVSKNSAGYALWNIWSPSNLDLTKPFIGYFDLTKLLIGSQGTLGLITEAKLRLVPVKKYSRLAVVFLSDLRPLADIVVEILKFKPESLESYDDKTFRVALRYFPEIFKIMGGNVLKLAFQFLPDVLMLLRGGVPKLVLMISFTSDDKVELEERLTRFKKAVLKFKFPIKITRNEVEAEKYFTIRRQSFRLLREHAGGKSTAPFIDDFIVQPKYLPEFLPKLNEILDKYKDKLIYTIAGHPGDGNFHIIPLMNLKDEQVRAVIPRLSEEVYDLVLRYNGSITAEHNDGLIRTPYLEKMFGKEVVKLFVETKKIFDPLNIFNPGKKTNMDIKTAMSYLNPK